MLPQEPLPRLQEAPEAPWFPEQVALPKPYMILEPTVIHSSPHGWRQEAERMRRLRVRLAHDPMPCSGTHPPTHWEIYIICRDPREIIRTTYFLSPRRKSQGAVTIRLAQSHKWLLQNLCFSLDLHEPGRAMSRRDWSPSQACLCSQSHSLPVPR